MRRLMKPALTSQLLVALLAAATVSTAADSPINVRLWPGTAPVGDGSYETVESELKVYLPPSDKTTGTAVVICPAGRNLRGLGHLRWQFEKCG